jgi:hypothetical protein
MVNPFLEEESRLLTPEAFEFVLDNELKRALRSQNFVTLLVLDPSVRDAAPEFAPTAVAPYVARVVSREVRETDLLSHTPDGRLSLVLLDADLNSSMRVVDRLLARFEHYQFPAPTTIAIGAACCPTHGADADSLRRAADLHRVHARRESRGNGTNPQ